MAGSAREYSLRAPASPVSLPESPVALRRPGTALGALLALGLLDQQMIAPLIAVVAVGLQVSVPEVGLTVSAYAFAASGTALVVGPLSDARGRRPFLLGAAALLLAVSAITALSSSYAAFLLARTGAGIAGGTISALAVAWVADLTPYRKRGRVMAILLGAAMATAVVGQIGAAFAAGRTGHQPVYGALAAGCALVLLALATLRETAARRPGRSAALGRQFGGYLRFLRHPPLRTAALAAFCMSASLVGVTTYGAGWLQESRGYSVSEVGLMYGALGAAILVTQPLAGPLADRFGKRRFAIGASIAAGLATVSLPLLSGVGLLAVLLLFGCVAVARMGAFTALRSELAGSDQRAAFLAFSNTFSQCGIAAAAAAGGLLYRSGFGTVCWSMAGFGALAAVLVARIPRPGPGPAISSSGRTGE